MPAPKITLYVDIVSPFAYMGYWLTRNAPAFKQCEITYVPVFLGGIFKITGNSPPLSIKNKDQWINAERMRWATNFNIPICKQMPDGFPVLTITIMRALCAIESSNPDNLPKAIDAVYEKFWVDRNESEVNKPEGLQKCLAAVLGEDEAKRIVKEASGDAAKKKLNENTDKAVADKAFGLPWFVATNEKGQTEGFWGVDHLGQVLQHLGIDKKKLGEGHQAML